MVRIGSEDWAAHRELRLRMLDEDPEAFWSPTDVRAWSEAQWRADAAGPRLHLQARAGSRTLGGIGVLPEGYDADDLVAEDEAHLVSLWVEPASRGRGLSRLLLLAAAELSLELGRPLLSLAVDSRNDVAQRLYERVGFERTGVEHVRGDAPSRWVHFAADATSLLEG